MSAHSRTPWTLRIEHAKTTDPRFAELGEYLSRAEILPGETLLAASHIRPLERSEAQIVADIRLMHAAPGLLGRLKVRVRECGCCGDPDFPTNMACSECLSDLDAIARAEGRS